VRKNDVALDADPETGRVLGRGTAVLVGPLWDGCEASTMTYELHFLGLSNGLEPATARGTVQVTIVIDGYIGKSCAPWSPTVNQGGVWEAALGTAGAEGEFTVITDKGPQSVVFSLPLVADR
jgi:hypothetical protein